MLLSTAALPIKSYAQMPTVIFSEIAWAGSSVSSSDEWIELQNLTNQSIDLSGWTITGAGSSDKTLTLPEKSEIAPYSTYLITNYEQAHENTAVASTPNFATTTLSLSNIGFDLHLYDNATALVDVAGGQGAPFAGRSGGVGDTLDGRFRSMERTNRLMSGVDKTTWQDSQTSYGFKSDIVDYGTPGIAQTFIEPAVSEITQEEQFPDTPAIDPIQETTQIVDSNVTPDEIQTETVTNTQNGMTSVESETPEDVAVITDESQSTTITNAAEYIVDVQTQEAMESALPSALQETVLVESTESTITLPVFGPVFINECVVDPDEGQTEWIELINKSDQSVSIDGWTVEDATGNKTPLETQTLEAGAFVIINAPKGKLNNDADVVILRDQNGVVVDEIYYGDETQPAPKDGTSIARDENGELKLTTNPTQGGVNVITDFVPEESETTIQADTSSDQDDESIDESSLVQTEQPSAEEVPLSTDTDSDSTNSTESQSSSEGSYTPGTLVINEFVVDPNENETEWVELLNLSDQTVTLDGWTIEDAVGKKTELPEVDLESGLYIIINAPKGRLNNDADTIIVKDPSGNTIDSVSYGDINPSPTDGNSLARHDDGNFSVTQQTTPGGTNIFSTASQDTESQTQENGSDENNASASQSESTQDEQVASNTTDDSLTQQTYTGPETLRFVKIYPNTEGLDKEEEFIEIKNTGSEPVGLKGWIIEDESTKRFTHTGSDTIAPGSSLKLMRTLTSLALNNSGDTLKLVSPNGNVIDNVNYNKAPQGSSFTLVDNVWAWIGSVVETQQTAPQVSLASTATTQTTTSNAQSGVYVSVSVAQAKERQDDARVRLTGSLTVAHGVFSTQVVYLQDETGGIQIFFSKAQYPDMAPGQFMTVRGQLSTAFGERRLKIENVSAIVLGAQGNAISPMMLDVNEIDESYVGELITTNGIIVSRSSNKLVIENGGDELSVYLKSEPLIDANEFERGDAISVTGVLTNYNGELRLRPRTREDITIKESAITALESDKSDSGMSVFESLKANAGIALFIATASILTLMAIMFVMPKRKIVAGA